MHSELSGSPCSSPPCLPNSVPDPTPAPPKLEASCTDRGFVFSHHILLEHMPYIWVIPSLVVCISPRWKPETYFPILPSSKGTVMWLGSASDRCLGGTRIQEGLQELGVTQHPSGRHGSGDAWLPEAEAVSAAGPQAVLSAILRRGQGGPCSRTDGARPCFSLQSLWEAGSLDLSRFYEWFLVNSFLV